MKLGLVPINIGVADGATLAAIARKSEQIGLESVWTFEHVMVPLEYDSTYPYSRTGKMPAAPETPFFDPLIALSYAAAATTKLRLGTGINILPQANPLLLAKQIASLDALSGGRFLFGAGVGWLKEEFQALGVPFERRGARFEDYVAALKKVWAGDVVEHESEWLSWRGFKSYPLPAQRPHPPIIVGGTTKAAMRRTARCGDGWFPANRDLKQLEELLSELRRVCDELGRDYSTVEITAMSKLPRDAAELDQYRTLGVSRIVIPVASFGTGSPLEALDKLADGVQKLGLAAD